MAKFQIKKDSKGQNYWVLKASNGEIVCWSESYSSYTNAFNSASWVKLNAPNAPIE